MSNQLTGVLREIYPVQEISDKFRKRDIVITDNSTQYEQHIKMQVTQDRCELFDKCNVGDEATVHFNIRGKQYTKKDQTIDYFTTLEVWKVETNKANQSQPQIQTPPPVNNASNVPNGSDIDDLPF